MKRSKNIFNSPIAPESLLQQEGNRQFQVGGLIIASNWLANVDPKEYKNYILSTLHLSELERELNDLKEENQKYQGNMRQSNLFKIGNVKKKIVNFTHTQVEEEQKKPLGEESLIKNQPPNTEKMVIQKIGGFFKGIIERKCKIQEKQLYIASQKDEKSPWITVGIAKYTIELESKQNALLNKKEEFKDFTWHPTEPFRLILWGKDLRSYCIYGSEEELKKFQRYFQVENIQKKQLGVFKKLDLQFQQKIITLFGNKVRFYDHNIRQRRAQKQVQYNSITKNTDSHERKREDSIVRPIKEISSEHGQSSEVGQSSELGQSGILEPYKTSNQKNMVKKSSINTSSQIILQGFATPEKTKISREGSREKQKGGSEIFKLKIKSSVVFYDEIQQPIHFDNQGNFSVADLKLNLKDQIGMSDVEEESGSRSGYSIKKGGKKIVHMSLKNALDQSQKYNINIHEASSLRHEGDNQAISSEGSLPDRISLSSKSLSISNINEPNINRRQFRKASEGDSMLEQFQLQRFRPDIDDDVLSQKSGSSFIKVLDKENTIERSKTLIKDFKKKKEGEIEIFQKIRKPSTYFAIQEIQMLAPYHKENLEFQILQIDPNLQMQRKIVACSRAVTSFQERKGTAQRYTFYSIPGGFHFQVASESDQFIFVLKEQGKHHYLRFDVDPCPKYQRNCSQLIIAKLDKEGYPFACSLIMFASPNPIQLKPPLSTIEFLQKYLYQGQSYDFKLDFIDDKRKRYLIKRQWNKQVLKNIVKNSDADAFARSVFLGMSDSIFNKLKASLNYNQTKLFNFTDNQLRMMEENISSAGVMDLRAFMKLSSLIKHISQANFNKYLRERIQQIYVYFLKRYGSTRNFALIFVKEVLSKIESIILMGKNQQQVYALVDLYFEVEYQIDEMFMEISKYFKK